MLQIEEDSKGGASESKSDDKGAKSTPAAPVEDEATKILKQKKTKLTSAGTFAVPFSSFFTCSNNGFELIINLKPISSPCMPFNPNPRPGYLVMLAAVIKLELLCGEVDKVKLLIDEAVELLDSMNGVEPIVYASVYHAKAEYHKLVGPAKDYYNTALQYLTYTPEDKLKGEDALHLAVDLVLASLVGENVYNFGEVLASPVMSLLVNSKSSWLYDIVKACNSGDIPAFNAIYSEHKADIAAQPALHASIDVVKQKVALLAFVELVFHRPSNQRVIPFIDIAAATSLPVDQIEWLLMKSMSIGLVKGHIDELEKTITVTWVQPRVLDNNQMDSIRNKLNEWAKTSHSTLLYVENNVGELLN
jgi:26S proteasome regulatory subunit N9